MLIKTANNRVGDTAAANRNLISGNGGSGVHIDGSAASGNIVEGNYIGLAADGTKAIGNNGNADVYINAAPSNIIGGSAAGAGNVISACPRFGVQFYQATGNTIQGNYVGVDATGMTAMPNGLGIYVYFSPGTTVGGTIAAARNVVSGNTGEGLLVQGDATGVQIQGNFIGTNKNGTAALGNMLGVSSNSAGFVLGGTSGVTPGGPCTGSCNVISGNTTVGVSLNNNSSGAIQIQGNFIGTDLTGNARVPNVTTGVSISSYSGATIGGTTAAARNVISGNSGDGLNIDGNGSSGNANGVTGNFIGTNTNGTQALGNGSAGVSLSGPVQQNVIGGTTAGSANVISGNLTGLSMSPSPIHGPNGPTQNIIAGNLIGTAVTGLAAIPNTGAGVSITTANSNIIGGTTSSARNVISGNSIGIAISGNAQSNQIQGNLVGTKVNGTEALGNSLDGVRVDDSTNNVIGVAVDPNTGAMSGAGNLISGNLQNGVDLERISTGANTNSVAGNFIGTDISGTKPLPNTGNGVLINGSSNNTVGGSQPALRNVISGNSGDGIDINAPATGNMVQGNYIGTNKDGTASLPNANGVFITNASGNFVGATTAITAGGPCTGGCNLISGNNANGIAVQGSTATGNMIVGNFIGTRVDGNVGLGNSLNGLILLAPQNTVGGTAVGARNVISANSRGILIAGADGTGNFVQGNFIGTNAAGNAALGNVGPGIRIDDASNNNIGGTDAAARNVISGNGAEGVDVPGGTGNVVQGNYIGADAAGTGPLGNTEAGVFIGNAPKTTVGGTASGAGNTIAYNSGAGVAVETSTGNSILSNSIFSNTNLGIDLGVDGVTPNDADDSDPGPNLLQNFPTIVSATLFDSKINVGGTLKSAPNTAFRIELFGNGGVDPSGFGEGQVFLGFVNVTTDGNGNASFTAILTYSSGVQKLSATATDPNGNTSEFSKSLQIASVADQLLNISTRLRVLGGDNALIGGFIVSGTESKKVIIRGIGPSLTTFGVPGALQDPVLELHDASRTLVSNDNWKSDQQAEIQASGLAPTNDLESAIIATLPANNASYTAILSGNGGSTGVGLVEVYDLAQSVDAKLANISARGFVDTNDNVMIGGLIVGGTGGGSTRVVLRAIGPSLGNFGVAGALQDPTLELHDDNGTLLVFNDNWKIRSDGSSQQAEIEATTIPPTNDLESALLQTLSPGNYTAIVRGNGNTTGVGLVEVYNLQ